MKIQELIDALLVRLHHGSAGVDVTSVVDDSRQVTPGSLFVARPGTTSDGARFIGDAVSRGAAAVLTREPIEVSGQVTVLLADEPAEAGLEASNLLYDYPASRLMLIGITGTNGKTTTAYMIRHLLNAAGRKCGLIGTIEIDTGGAKPQAAELTTPGAIQLTALLAQMLSNGCDTAVMEVSSHALDQGRVEPAMFEVAVFTNLTGDHLDYHGTMDAYAAAKAKLFEGMRCSTRAWLNIDDPYHRRMLAQEPDNAQYFSATNNQRAWIRARVEWSDIRGSMCELFPWNVHALLPLIGRHNVSNMLGALATCSELGLNSTMIKPAIESCPQVPGRLERVNDATDRFDVFVDYAHTDDALANVLTALRPVTKNRLRVVFGCGGDRDRTKRPRMAKIACELADDVVITSDNPRTENPAAIIDDIVAGVPESNRDTVVIEPDRDAAIRLAINAAEPGDVVLIAGKGHEDYQIIGTVKHHFDDREQAAAALADRFARVV